MKNNMINLPEDIKIRVDNIFVQFNLANEKISHLKEYVIKLIKHQLLFQKFFALQNISFEVSKGESWGIVGKNGSGKSTLLKTISGILKPYKGRMQINGTISPLIELGAGFDGEMTARENIFLNGCVLGYSEDFLKEKFDEIVDFSEISDFLDVPLKNFSSGMSARLGFAIATTVKPDILICDEVLSVGDFKFQEKCEERMNDLLSGGTTLLFVSHSIDQVMRMCKKAIWLECGKIRMIGDAYEVCERYEKS